MLQEKEGLELPVSLAGLLLFRATAFHMLAQADQASARPHFTPGEQGVEGRGSSAAGSLCACCFQQLTLTMSAFEGCVWSQGLVGKS